MKKFLAIFIFILCGFAINCKSQDTIIKNSGEKIGSQVLEVTQTEIKYKGFDNKTGPLFTISKSDVTMIKYENGTKDIFNQPVLSSKISKCNIYFIRDESSKKAIYKVQALIDNMLVCELPKNSYSVHSVTAGKHAVTAEYGVSKTKTLEIDLEDGKDYYFKIFYKVGAIVYTIYCVEIEKSVADPILTSLKLNSECK